MFTHIDHAWFTGEGRATVKNRQLVSESDL